MPEHENMEEFEILEPQHDQVENVEISKEMKESFLDYSMSGIVQRARPGLGVRFKPVHPRSF